MRDPLHWMPRNSRVDQAHLPITRTAGDEFVSRPSVGVGGVGDVARNDHLQGHQQSRATVHTRPFRIRRAHLDKNSTKVPAQLSTPHDICGHCGFLIQTAFLTTSRWLITVGPVGRSGFHRLNCCCGVAGLRVAQILSFAGQPGNYWADHLFRLHHRAVGVGICSHLYILPPAAYYDEQAMDHPSLSQVCLSESCTRSM